METIIENAQLELPTKNRLFNTKEEYLNMRQAWKDYHTNGHAKGKWVETTHRPWTWRHKPEVVFINRVKVKPLDASHYLLYNLLRGLPAHRGFMQDWANPTDGYAAAYVALEWELGKATKLPSTQEGASESYIAWAMRMKLEAIARLTEPFGETVTEEHLATVLERMKEGAYRDLLEDETA